MLNPQQIKPLYNGLTGGYGYNRELGTTLVLVTHNLSLAEQAEQIVHIAHGAIVP